MSTCYNNKTVQVGTARQGVTVNLAYYMLSNTMAKDFASVLIVRSLRYL